MNRCCKISEKYTIKNIFI